MPTTHHASNSKKVADVLLEAVSKGWHVLATTELLFEGTPPELISSDSLSEHPTQVLHLTIVLKHGDHFHLLTFTLAKPELDTRTHALTDEILLAYQQHAMDEQATVAVSGTA